MSTRRLRVRLSIGTLLVVLVVLVSAHDAQSPSFRIGSILAASLGAIALVEYARIAGLAAVTVGRAMLGAGVAVLFWRTIADFAGLREGPQGLFCVGFGLACAAPVAAAVLVRRSTPVLPEDVRALALALLGLVIVVFPALCLIEIGYLEPKSGFSPRSCAFFSPGGRAITENGVGPWLLLVTILVSKLNDIGGYLVGSLVGRTPLAPGISPKKSVEGAAAGLILGAGGSLLAFSWFCPTAAVLRPLQAGAFGIILSLLTQIGDLCESLIKRAFGVKDSAALIPAFGGILDLLDSFILAAPAGYTLLWMWTS